MTSEGLLAVVIAILGVALVTISAVLVGTNRSFKRELEAQTRRAEEAWDKVLEATKDDALVEGLITSLRNWRKQVGNQFLTTTTHDAHIQLLLIVDKFEEDLRK